MNPYQPKGSIKKSSCTTMQDLVCELLDLITGNLDWHSLKPLARVSKHLNRQILKSIKSHFKKPLSDYFLLDKIDYKQKQRKVCAKGDEPVIFRAMRIFKEKEYLHLDIAIHSCDCNINIGIENEAGNREYLQINKLDADSALLPGNYLINHHNDTDENNCSDIFYTCNKLPKFVHIEMVENKISCYMRGKQTEFDSPIQASRLFIEIKKGVIELVDNTVFYPKLFRLLGSRPTHPTNLSSS